MYLPIATDCPTTNAGSFCTNLTRRSGRFGWPTAPRRCLSRLVAGSTIGGRVVPEDRHAERHPADPPRPIPTHLWPLRSPLEDGDLRIAPSTAELRALARTLDAEGLAGQTFVTMREGSPWLKLDVAVVVGGRVYRYALWRYTLKVYRVGDDGAVEDDPINLGRASAREVIPQRMTEPPDEIIASAIENTLGTTPGVGDAARRAVDELENAGYSLIPNTFVGLVKLARAMLDYNYPEEVFGSEPAALLDSGARFVSKLREALAQVHAEDSPAPVQKDAPA